MYNKNIHLLYMSVIGEGTYGCIHKPSLKCNNSDIDYENKVSKILENDEADAEMKEFRDVSNFDKNNQFFLGVPHRCSPAKTQENIESIEKCKNGKELVVQLQHYSLLVMEDGGMDLEKYGKILKLREPTEENREKMELFWMEAHRILIGLRAFLNNRLVHHDLKPQNIVYNEKSNRLNFIDFGLMDTKSNLIKSALREEYPFPIFHWYFPPELPFLEKDNFEQISEKSEEEKIKYLDDLITYNRDNNKYNETAEQFKVMLIFFYKYAFGSENPDNHLREFFLNGIQKTIVDYIKPSNFRTFLEKSVNTIDIYGTGISFLYVLNHSEHMMEPNIVILLRNMFFEMITADLFLRIDINELIEKYEHILETTGLLFKHKKRFENNILIERIEEIPTVHLESMKLSPKEIQDIITNDPTPSPSYKKSFSVKKTTSYNKKSYTIRKTPKKCPEGKVLNPKTNRCNKTKKQRICPKGKILNLKTNRCIKINNGKTQHS